MPTFTSTPDLCGDITLIGAYGPVGSLVDIDDDDTPLAFNSPDFVVDTDDDALIGTMVPYSLTATFEDYQLTDAPDAAETVLTNAVSYLDPCPVIGASGFSWTTFEASSGASTLTTDAYTEADIDIDANSLFNISPDFCDDTVTFTCTGVTGPDGSGGTTSYAAGTYPFSLCTITNDELTVSAGPSNYRTTDNAAVYMPPGTYTFTIQAEAESASGVTAETRTKDVTWTLTDPCDGQTITMSAFTLTTDEYTINDTDLDDNALPTITASPDITTAGQSLEDFCTVTYVFSVGD